MVMNIALGLSRINRRFPRLLTKEEVCNLSQRDFVDYCREQIRERMAREELGKDYEMLDWHSKLDIDLRALLTLAKAMAEVSDETPAAGSEKNPG